MSSANISNASTLAEPPFDQIRRGFTRSGTLATDARKIIRASDPGRSRSYGRFCMVKGRADTSARTKNPHPSLGGGVGFGANGQATWKPTRTDHPMPKRSGTLGRLRLCLTDSMHALTCVASSEMCQFLSEETRAPNEGRPWATEVRSADLIGSRSSRIAYGLAISAAHAHAGQALRTARLAGR